VRTGRKLQDVIDILTERHDRSRGALPPLRPVRGGSLHEARVTLGEEEVEFLIPVEIGADEEQGRDAQARPDAPPTAAPSAETSRPAADREVAVPSTHEGEARMLATVRVAAPLRPPSIEQVLRAAPEWSDPAPHRAPFPAPHGSGNVVVSLESGARVILPGDAPPHRRRGPMRLAASAARLLHAGAHYAMTMLDSIDAAGRPDGERLSRAVEALDRAGARLGRLWMSWRSWQAARR
jgi:hypothetical protein